MMDNPININPDVLFPEFADSMKQISETANSIIKNFATATIDIKPVIDEIAENLPKTISVIQNYDFLPSIQESLEAIRKAASELLKSITIPTISDERKQELLDSHCKWGEYGWTVNPLSDFERLFYQMPDSKEEADKSAIRQCREMDKIFEKILSERRVKKTDFNEAVADYNNKSYKSCALLLFSMIDAQLIRLQKFPKDEKDNRNVGKTAVRKAKERMTDQMKMETIFSAMFLVNLFSCLETMFAGGGFKVQPKIINRNFLAHGMMKSPVRKRDCIQLFLLYYNMLELLELLFL